MRRRRRLSSRPATDDPPPGGSSASAARGEQRIRVPRDGLVLLVGVAGSGKSTFAARHFAPTEVLSSDRMRAIVADDPNDQRATDDAFRLLHEILEMRLARGRLTVVDATNVEEWARRELVAIARRRRRLVAAIVLDLPIEVALDRNAARRDGRRPAAAVRRQQRWLRQDLAGLASEGIAAVHVLRSPDEVDAAQVERG